MTVKPPNRNDPCRCHNGKKFKKCCFLKKPYVAGREPTSYLYDPLRDNGPTCEIRPSTRDPRPTVWRPPPERPKLTPPKGTECTDYVFVKGKGWTHERDLKPGDQLRMKDGSWDTVKPDQVIETTDEHPFFVKGKGWTPANEIRPGDEVRTEDGWIPIKSSESTGRFEPVYNFRIADFHTYFVGCDEWGFAVWAHNAVQPHQIAQFDYGGLDILALYDRLVAHTPNSLSRTCAYSGKAVTTDILLPNIGLKTAGVVGPMDMSIITSPPNYSFADYAVIETETGKVVNTGKLGKGKTDGLASTLDRAFHWRFLSDRHDYFHSSNAKSRAVIALIAYPNEKVALGGERFLFDVLAQKGQPLEYEKIPLGLTKDNWQTKARAESATSKMTAFLEYMKGIGMLPQEAEIKISLKKPGATTGC